MNVVPAQIAGVSSVAVASPPQKKNGGLPDEIVLATLKASFPETLITAKPEVPGAVANANIDIKKAPRSGAKSAWNYRSFNQKR